MIFDRIARCLFLSVFLLLLPVRMMAQSEVDTLQDGVVDAMESVAADSVSIMLQGFDKKAYKNTPYWSRNKAKNFAGTSTLAVGGVTLLFYSFIKLWVEGESLGWADYVLGGGGGLLVASSVPLYVSAAKDRKKAKQSVGSFVPQRDYRYLGFRYEVTCGATYPTKVYSNADFAPCYGIEGRTFIGDSNFDVAAKFSLEHVYNESDPYYDHDWETIFRLTAFADYNFSKGSVVNPYVGCGIGGNVESVHLEPRAGLELWKRHRIALQWRKILFRSDPGLDKYDNLSLTYGFSF